MLRMFTEPVEVDRRREIIRAVPLDGGSIEDNREFLIANASPCKRFSSGSLACQYKV